MLAFLFVWRKRKKKRKKRRGPKETSRFIFGTEARREVVSLELAGIIQNGKWLVLNARDGKFPAFFRKKIGTQKMRPRTQTSTDNFTNRPLIFNLLIPNKSLLTR